MNPVQPTACPSPRRTYPERAPGRNFFRARLSLAFAALGIAGLLADAGPAAAQDAVGLNVHVPGADFVALAEEAGVGWIRVDANWFQLEPERGRYRWEVLDPGVRAAREAGLEVYVTLAYTPEWVPKVARPRDDDYTGNDEPVGSDEWVTFVEAAVRHYRELGVTHFGLWNEPNLDGFWDGDIDAYVDKIALPGAAAVRRVCAECRTLGPDLAHVGEVDEALDRILARAASAFDILAHHLYGGWEENGHRVFDGDSFLNALEDRRFAFTRASLREVLDRHGWTGEVWITETGYRVRTIGHETERAKQATYVRRVLEEQLERDWWTNSFFYEITDCGVDQPECGIDGYGLTRPTRGYPRTADDYERKPAFETLRGFVADHPELGGGAPMTAACANGRDDDGDGRVDLEDRGCVGAVDGDEADGPRRRVMASPGAVRVDGRHDEWAEAVWVDATGWRGEGDRGELRARLAAAWESGVVYLAVEVVDDAHVNGQPDAMLWASDSVQLAFDPGRDFGEAGYDGDDHELDVALVEGVARAFRQHGSGDDGWTVAATREGDRTRYEMALPAAVLGGSGVSAGAAFGFSWLVNDDDGEGRRGWAEWTPGIGGEKAPYWFGELVLTSAPPAGEDAGPGAEPGLDGGAAPGGDAGVGAEDGGGASAPGDGSGGGGCAAAGARGRSGVAWLAALLAFGAWRRRRRDGRDR